MEPLKFASGWKNKLRIFLKNCYNFPKSINPHILSGEFINNNSAIRVFCACWEQLCEVKFSLEWDVNACKSKNVLLKFQKNDYQCCHFNSLISSHLVDVNNDNFDIEHKEESNEGQSSNIKTLTNYHSTNSAKKNMQSGYSFVSLFFFQIFHVVYGLSFHVASTKYNKSSKKYKIKI